MSENKKTKKEKGALHDIGTVNVIILKGKNNQHTITASVADSDYLIKNIKTFSELKVVSAHGNNIENCIGVIHLTSEKNQGSFTMEATETSFDNDKRQTQCNVAVVVDGGTGIYFTHNPKHKVIDPWRV